MDTLTPRCARTVKKQIIQIISYSGAAGSRASAAKYFKDTLIVPELFYPLFQSLSSEYPNWVLLREIFVTLYISSSVP